MRLLQRVENKPKSCVPLLVECLDDTNHIKVVAETLRNLSMIGPGAKDALPKLRKMRKQPIADDYFFEMEHKVVYRCGDLINEAIKKIEGK